CLVKVMEVALEESGPLRTVARVTGVIADRAGERLQAVARLHFFAGLPTVRVSVTVRNPRPATHPGGFWELGDANSVLLRDVSLTIGLRGGGEARAICSPEID